LAYTNVFGITQLFNRDTSKPQWLSTKWGTDGKRTLKPKKRKDRTADPKDPWLDFACHGWEDNPVEHNEMTISGTGGNNGTASISGEHTRFYIYKPTDGKTPIWLNTEMTAYGMYKGAWPSGPVKTWSLRSRTNHHKQNTCVCNGRGYISQMGPGGNKFEFRKELVHGWYGNKPMKTVPHFNKDVWIGMKFVTQTQGGNKVRLRTWLDYSNGKNGGEWKLHADLTDAGNWAVNSNEAARCATARKTCNGNSKCLDPSSKWAKSPWKNVWLDRGCTCYNRIDSVKNFQMKWFDIHEISALP
jgi:hypothetical protein